jgi:site-specific recombinase XerD
MTHILTADLIKNFKRYLVDIEKSDATLEQYIRNIKMFAKWNHGRNINKILVLEYKQMLIEKYSPASVNAKLSSLNSFFNFVDWIDCRVKTLKIQKSLFASKEKELTKNEYEKLLEAARKKGDYRLFMLLQTLCATGIRVSELKFVTVEAVKNGYAKINCKGKMRDVLLPRQLCRLLKNYLKKNDIKSGSIFITRSGKPLDRKNIWTAMKNLCSVAGVSKEKVFPHNLRHLFAKTFYSLYKDIVRLADILGHSSVNTTRIYTMESGEIHRNQIQNLGLLRC